MIIRIICGAVCFTCVIFAIEKLPLSLVSVLADTAPMWSAIFDYVIFSIVMSKTELVCLIGAFSGVVVLALANENNIKQYKKNVTKFSFKKVQSFT